MAFDIFERVIEKSNEIDQPYILFGIQSISSNFLRGPLR